MASHWCGLALSESPSAPRLTAPQYARRLLAATYGHLDRLEEARSEAEEHMKIVPDFSITTWAKTEYYTDPKELQRYVDGLRKAGLSV